MLVINFLTLKGQKTELSWHVVMLGEHVGAWEHWYSDLLCYTMFQCYPGEGWLGPEVTWLVLMLSLIRDGHTELF